MRVCGHMLAMSPRSTIFSKLIFPLVSEKKKLRGAGDIIDTCYKLGVPSKRWLGLSVGESVVIQVSLAGSRVLPLSATDAGTCLHNACECLVVYY